MSLIINDTFTVDNNCTNYDIEFIEPISVMEKHDDAWYEKKTKGSINLNIKKELTTILDNSTILAFQNKIKSGYLFYNNYYYPVDVVVGVSNNIKMPFTITFSWDGTSSVTKPILLAKEYFITNIESHSKEVKVFYDLKLYSSDTVKLFVNGTVVAQDTNYLGYIVYNAPLENTDYTFKIMAQSISGNSTGFSDEVIFKSGIETNIPTSVQATVSNGVTIISFIKDTRTFRTEIEIDDVVTDIFSFENSFNLQLLCGETYKYRLRSISSTQFCTDWTQYYTITL